MWFALGFVSLGFMLVGLIRARWFLSWKGTEAASSRLPRHRYNLITYHKSDVGIDVGVPVPDFFRFELKRERWTDRLFKWVGLAVEKQFGHDSFDRLVYVASDDDHLLNKVANSTELQEAATKLFNGVTLGARMRHVRCANGWLIARLVRVAWFSHENDAQWLLRAKDVALPQLDRLAEALRSAEPPSQPQARRDPYLLPGVVLVSISTALGINGFMFLLRPALDDAFLTDTWPITWWTFWIGSGVVAVLFLAHLWLLGRSARAHLYLLELLLIGTAGAYTTAAVEIREANIAWDTAPAVVRQVPVTDRSISRSRRTGTRHYLHVADWNNPSRTLRVSVSSAEYQAAAAGRPAMFEERPGRFGASWARFSGFQPVKSSSLGSSDNVSHCPTASQLAPLTCPSAPS